MDIPARIEQKIDRVPLCGCWIWTGAHTSGGRYGSAYFGGRVMPAHRAVWEIVNGAIPDGMELLHKCDVGLCVNPSHLMVGTHAENMADMVAKGRQRSIAGDNHWTRRDKDKAVAVAKANITNSHGSGEENNNAKITLEIANKIRSAYSSNPYLAMTELGAMFGLKREQTRKIVKGLAWNN